VVCVDILDLPGVN